MFYLIDDKDNIVMSHYDYDVLKCCVEAVYHATTIAYTIAESYAELTQKQKEQTSEA